MTQQMPWLHRISAEGHDVTGAARQMQRLYGGGSKNGQDKEDKDEAM